MNFVEEFILFIFALLAMLTINARYSFGQDIICAKQILPSMNTKYLFVGEDHRDFKSKEFLAKYASTLKKIGFEVAFVEYIESKDQPILDLYNLEPESNRENVYRTYGQPGDWGYDSRAYLYLTDVLGQNEIKIYGLDRRSDLRINMDPDKKMALRDQHMFKVARDFIKKNPDKKIIFFNGSSHSFVNANLTRPSFYQLFIKEFAASNIKNLKVDYYWNDSVSTERLYLSMRTPLPKCDFDFLLYNPPQSKFNYYIFENTDILLPHLSFINTRAI